MAALGTRTWVRAPSELLLYALNDAIPQHSSPSQKMGPKDGVGAGPTQGRRIRENGTTGEENGHEGTPVGT